MKHLALTFLIALASVFPVLSQRISPKIELGVFSENYQWVGNITKLSFSAKILPSVYANFGIGSANATLSKKNEIDKTQSFIGNLDSFDGFIYSSKSKPPIALSFGVFTQKSVSKLVKIKIGFEFLHFSQTSKVYDARIWTTSVRNAQNIDSSWNQFGYAIRYQGYTARNTNIFSIPFNIEYDLSNRISINFGSGIGLQRREITEKYNRDILDFNKISTSASPPPYFIENKSTERVWGVTKYYSIGISYAL